MKLMFFVILMIKYPRESFQEEIQTFIVPSNITMFDLSQVRINNSITKIIVDNNLLKNLTNSNKTENLIVKKLDLSNNLIEFVDKYAFLNFKNLEDVSLGQNRLKYFDIHFTSNLKCLRLPDNQIQYINGESFKNLKNLFVLELHFNKIEIIRNDTYIPLYNMEYLILFKNSIRAIQDGSFATMTKLKFLFLFSNRIEKIRKKMFQNLSSLTQLWLFENGMIEIEPESFIDLKCLENLHLYSNKLSFLDNLTFVGLNSLQELWLQKNNLKQIEPIFSNLSNLKYFVFDNNELELVHPDCFVFNENLIKIELFSNGISQITNLNIEHLMKLEELDLSSNLLTHNFYLNHTHMLKLDLNSNRIVEFIKKMFLPNLLKLLVSNNRVQTLSNNVFIYLKSLKELDFSANRLIKIDNMAFHGLINLKSLYLKNNYLDESNYFLENLVLLENLDLSYNYFKFLSEGYFKSLINLKNLKLNNNHIKEISSSLFAGNTELTRLYLSSNNLRTISLNLSQLEIFEINFNQVKVYEFNLPALKRLCLANNQIDVLNLSKTSMLEFIDLGNNIFKTVNDSAIFEANNLKSFRLNGSYDFGFEKILNQNQLIELDLSFNNILIKNFSLKSLIKLEKIRFRGIKNFNNFESLLKSNLKEVDFSKNPLKNRFSMFDILENLEILELSDVELDEIIQIRFENFQNLMKLDLSHNHLAYLNGSTFNKMSKLTYLDLSFNRIRNLNVDIFKWLQSLVYLNLEQNYICSLGDVFLNYLDIEILKLANNCLEKLPQFEIKKDTKRPIPLKVVDLELNRLESLPKFSNGINGIESLILDSNNISIIDHDALIYLNGLKILSLSNNRLNNLTFNNFFGLFSLEHLNVSRNCINFIEQKTFQNLNKLLHLDLSSNLFIALDANIFYGLKNLKSLYLKNIAFKLNNQSFNYLSNISNIHLDGRIVEENECLLIESLKRIIIKESFFYRDQIRQVNRFYFSSLNFLSFLPLTNKSCDMKLFYLQFNIHLNLMSDNDLENFYDDCGRFIVKKENYYDVNKIKCSEPIRNKAKRVLNLNLWLTEYCVIIMIFITRIFHFH